MRLLLEEDPLDVFLPFLLERDLFEREEPLPLLVLLVGISTDVEATTKPLLAQDILIS